MRAHWVGPWQAAATAAGGFSAAAGGFGAAAGGFGAAEPVVEGPERAPDAETPDGAEAGADAVRRRGWRRPLTSENRWVTLSLLAVTAVAAASYACGITSDGLEMYYAAGVRSMAGSWHDFLYGGFDPHGLITLDKLPGGFWMQALSVRAFGLSVWAMVLPQVIAGVLTVLVLFRAVRRIAGPWAGVVAAAILAVSPVTITSIRGNLADPLFLLLVVLAADATLRAVESGRLRTLIVAGVWVGLAFQAKMTEAWLVLPALAVTYVIAAPVATRRRFAQLTAAGLVTVTVSMAWMLLIAVTPAHDRPYEDGSTHNSVFEQVFVYNTAARLGHGPPYGLPTLAKPSAQARAYARQPTAAANVPAAYQSRPAWDRLLTGPLAADAGWLLPSALAAAFAGVAARWRAPRTDRLRAGFLLWGVWLITFTTVFSASHIVQSYYLATLVPAIAALCALGLKLAVRSFHAARPSVLAAIGLLGTALWSSLLVGGGYRSWRWAALALVIASAAMFGAALRRSTARSRWAVRAAALAAAVSLAGPVAATAWLLTRSAGPFDTPFASTGTFARSSQAAFQARVTHRYYGGTIIPSLSASRWNMLLAEGMHDNRILPPGMKMAIFTSAEASGFVLGGARQILPIGGFTGDAPFPTTGQLASMIAQGKIRWAIVPGTGDLRANDPRVQAILQSCLHLRSLGASADADPTTVTAAPQLYDCSL